MPQEKFCGSFSCVNHQQCFPVTDNQNDGSSIILPEKCEVLNGNTEQNEYADRKLKNSENHLNSKGLNNFRGEDQTNSLTVHQEIPDYFLDYGNIAPMNMRPFAICSTKGEESTPVSDSNLV